MGFDAEQDAYLRLREIVAERTRPLLAWVGSGLSMEAGLPSWAGLREVLIETLRNKAATFHGDEERRLTAAAETAQTAESPWVAFQVLEKGLGKQSYQDVIRQQFLGVDRAPIPAAYADLWQLRLKGMLTLNLDRLAVRSLSDYRADQMPLEMSGSQVGRLRRELSGPRPVVANLHGILEDTQTWVFTQNELAGALSSLEYRGFLEVCFSMFTIVFVGISIQDVAVGGPLSATASLEIENPTHYWITPIRELAVDQWAESVGVRAVRYSAPDGDHSELTELFQDLRSYVSKDTDDPPPIHLLRDKTAEPPEEGLPTEEELLRRSPNEVREILNAHAATVLEPETPEAYAAYDRFAADYDQAIYVAWYTSDKPTKNDLLGYELVKREARGAFGNVYRARTPEGSDVAVKILLDEIRQDPESLRAFRRGVRSMRILQERGTEGMVAYLAASEIPAFVVMDWIDGPNLSEAKATKVIDDWYSVLDIGLQLARIIRSAHMLPERVLHRDIRPANVMLRDYWTDPDRREVVVLDFDLSWHKGAEEKSVMHTTSVGYLAPEQIRQTAGSTRSALVDSFGLGMTLLFLCTGEDPVPDQHRHETWVADVKDACEALPRHEWTSLPQRFARLILAATRDSQSARWDLSEIERELEQLLIALKSPANVTAPEMLAEELAARCHVFREYTWNPDRGEADRSSPTGVRLFLRGDAVNDEVAFSLVFDAQGGEDRAKLNRYLSEQASTVADQLRASGWTILSRDVGYASLDIAASMRATTVGDRLAETADRLDQIVGRLRFDRD